MGLTSIFYVATSGLKTSQSAMDVASHNIANVNTEGYSRQRLNITTNTPSTLAVGPVGRGVQAVNIQRMHDRFVEANLVAKTSILAKYEAQKISMDALESVFNESQGDGINEALSNFWSAWQDVGNNPEGYAERMNLLEKGDTLTQSLNVMREDMDKVRNDINRRVEEGVSQANTLVQEIAEINGDIMALEVESSKQANDLRDARQQHLNDLAEFMDIQYYEDPANGAVQVLTPKGTPLVMDDSAWNINAKTDAESGDIRVMWERGGGGEVDISENLENGKLGGWIELRDEIMAEFYAQLESFTRALILEVNKQHSQGVGLNQFTQTTGSYGVENFAAQDAELDGYDNDIHFKSRVEGENGDRIGIRFIKAGSIHEPLNVRTEVVGAGPPPYDEYNITVVLPINQSGQVTATAEDVVEVINEDRTSGLGYPTDLNNLPGPPYHAGDLIDAEAAWGELGSGRVDEWRNPEAGSGGFYRCDFELQHLLPLGEEIEYGHKLAQYETDLAGDDNDMVFRVRPEWVDANSPMTGEEISVEMVDPGAPNAALAVNVVGERITVSLATDANSNIISTANEVINAVTAHATAGGMVEVERAEGDNGAGVVTSMIRQPLDKSGGFDLTVYDSDGQPQTTRIYVRPDDELTDVIDQINAVEVIGVSAVLAGEDTETGTTYMRVQAEDGYTFAFGNDNSNGLAALGINTFFEGDRAVNIKLNDILNDDPGLIASGQIDQDGFFAAGDNVNALETADLKDVKFSIRNQNSTISEAYNTLSTEVGAESHAITRNHDFNNVLVDNIHAQRDMVSAVNLDEEMADLLKFQYMYQASAKMISAVDEMFQTLLSVK